MICFRTMLCEFVDDKVDQVKVYETMRVKMDGQIQSLRQTINTLEDRLEQAHQDSSTHLRHQATYEVKIHSLIDENNILKQKLSQKTAEISNAASDVQVFLNEYYILTPKWIVMNQFL